MSTLLARLSAKSLPEPNTGCVLFDGAHSAAGYGVLNAGKHGRSLCAHRVSYELHCGPVPEGHYVLHRCDVPCCVNPDHLFTGTQSDNMRDMTRKARQSRGVARPSAKLNDEAVRVIRASDEQHTTLAKRFNVSEITIQNVRARRKWRHVV